MSHLSLLLQLYSFHPVVLSSFFHNALIDLDGSLTREGNLNPVGILSNRVADVMESLSIPYPPHWYHPAYDMLKEREKRSPTSEELTVDCPICLKTYIPSDALIDLPCEHAFHRSCLLRWMEVVRKYGVVNPRKILVHCVVGVCMVKSWRVNDVFVANRVHRTFFRPERMSKPTSTHWILSGDIFPAILLPAYPPTTDPQQIGTADRMIISPAL